MARIGQYQIGELLGEGGLGRVHAAYDVVLEREVAIKSLRTEFLNDAGFVARFRAEATNLARLNHPNITTVHALLEQGRSLYIVMERVHGQTLEALLRQHRRGLGYSESLAVFSQAADGLAYAHAMGVIHRDIKPANIMIVPASGLVKIMDFGIARLRGSQHHTREGSIIGTLTYMAPEQLRGEPTDERSDLYSLAIVLQEMLTGSPPFAGKTEYELLQAQLHAKPQRLHSLIPDADPKVAAALQRALAKRPEHRFASVTEFRDAVGARRRSPLALTAGDEAAPSAGGRSAHTDWTERLARLRLTLAGSLPAAAEATTRRMLAALPAATRIPVIVGAAGLALGLASWGAFTLMSGGSAPAARGAGPIPVNSPPAHHAAAEQPSRNVDPTVVLAPPVLYPARTTKLDHQDEQ